MNKNFYIFRHGESTYNVARRVQGHSDDSILTEKGRQQAFETAKILQDKKIEIIISSPLKRAKETGDIISEIIKAPITCDQRFMEVNIGIIEGMLYDEVLQKYGELYQRWQSSDKDFVGTCFDKGETKQEVRKRVFEGLEYYAKKSHYYNIGISAHGIILIQSLLALGIEQNDIPNGAIIHLIYDDSQWECKGFITH